MITLEERLNKLEGLINRLVSDVESGIRVSLPAKVTAFNPEKQTISCIPLIRELININGSVKYVDIPEIVDVPICMPRAGNWAITLPVEVGNECLLIFQDLCIDGWWFRGGIQNWSDLRRHDFSDAIAIFSPWSQPNTIPSYSTQGLEIRSLDGTKKITLSNDNISIQAPSGLNIIGDVNIQGELNSTGDVIGGGVSLKNHTHPGVTPGGGNTGVPNP